jgi:S1-C subfamily serine protease
MPHSVLRVISGAGAGREIALQDELVIGREAVGDGRLDGEPALSRRHARISRGADGALTIEDLGSLNGTSVNGKRIAAATILRRGDEIKLGATVIVVAAPGDPPPRAASARSHDTVLADVPASAARARRPTFARDDLAVLAARPAVRTGAAAALAAAAVVLWLALSGGGGSSESVARDGARSTVQLIVQPSAIVRRLAAVVPATAPPRSGSGIVVDARRGLILTADRLVAGASRISGRFGGGRAQRATLVARAPCDGVALVRLAQLPDGARAAPLGSAGDLRRGERVFALGYPGSRVGRGGVRGGRLRAVAGVIAGGRARATLDPADPRLSGLVLHTARPRAGGGGGPLVDRDGKVLGLNLVAADRGPIAGALSIERVQGLYGDLATARTERDAGWRLEPWSEIRGRGARGLLVTGVDRGGPAQRAAVPRRARAAARRPSAPLLGATVFAVNGITVRDAGDVCRALAGVRRGERVSVRADIRSAVLAGRGLGRASRTRSIVVRLRL